MVPETDALLARLGDGGSGEWTYEELVAARAEPPDRTLSRERDPRVHASDLYLPPRAGPTLARIYRIPDPAPRQLLLWLHGGSWIGGTVGDLDYPCSRLTALAGVTVVSLEYRLAPEHPFPAALHDTYDALRWLAKHGDLIGGNGTLEVGGQSAGGGLAAGACLLARDQGVRLPVVRQVLCYPALDFGQDSESARLFDGVFHSVKPGQWDERQYLAGLPVIPYAAPLRAADLSAWSPTRSRRPSTRPAPPAGTPRSSCAARSRRCRSAGSASHSINCCRAARRPAHRGRS